MFPSAEGDLRQSNTSAFSKRPADGGHGASLRVILGNKKVRTLEERRINVVAWDKVLKGHGLLSGKAKAFEVLRLDHEVSALLVFKSFGDVLRLDRFVVRGGFAVVNSLAGLAVDFVKCHLPSRGACRHNANSK